MSSKCTLTEALVDNYSAFIHLRIRVGLKRSAMFLRIPHGICVLIDRHSAFRNRSISVGHVGAVRLHIRVVLHEVRDSRSSRPRTTVI